MMGGLANPPIYSSGHEPRAKRPDVCGAMAQNKQARYRQRLRLTGRCPRCGKASTPYYYCGECRLKIALRNWYVGIVRRVAASDPMAEPAADIFKAACVVLGVCLVGLRADVLVTLLRLPRSWIENVLANLVGNGIFDSSGVFLGEVDRETATLSVWLSAMAGLDKVRCLPDQRWELKR